MTETSSSAMPLAGRNLLPPGSKRPAGTEKRRHGELLRHMTIDLIAMYSRCSDDFKYSKMLAPRRVLTKLAKGVHNGGNDNAEHDYICRVNDKIQSPDGITYEIVERLGHGTFGQVLKCQPSNQATFVALKIIKNKPAYFQQALVEVRILQMLNEQYDPDDQQRIVRMLDYFVYRKHLCIAFELLSVNLYDVLKQNSFRGVSTALIRVFTEQLLRSMQCLRQANVIHCDLKPENVLLSSMQHTRIKLIDFGSACFENHTVYSYIQSRFYRSPEVLLGLPYTSAIDMWSLGCICAELFLGLPVFPGHSEFDQVCRIVEILGLPPHHMLEAGKNTRKYFRRAEGSNEQDNASEHSVGSGDGASGDDPTKPTSSGEQGAASSAAGGAAERSGTVEIRTDASLGGSISEGSSLTELLTLNRYGQYSAAFEKEGITLPKALELSDADLQKFGVDDEHRGPLLKLFASSGGEVATNPFDDSHPEEVAAAVALEPPASGAVEGEDRRESLLDIAKRALGVSGAEAPKPGPEAPKPSGLGPGPVLDDGSTACPSNRGGGGHARMPSGGSACSTAAETQHGLCTSRATRASTGSRDTGPGTGDDELDPSSDSRGVGDGQRGASGSSDYAGAARGGQLGAPRPRRSRGRRRGARPVLWRIKTREEYMRDEHKQNEQTPKKYFNFTNLEQMVELVPYKSNLSRRDLSKERQRRECFLQFLRGVLVTNPTDRWTPKQAFGHSFVTQGPYDPFFTPEPDAPPAPLRAPPHTLSQSGGDASAEDNSVGASSDAVPRLPAEAFTQPSGAFSGGGSARTWQENSALHRSSASSSSDPNHPRSAPASTRGGRPQPSARGGFSESGERLPEEREAFPGPAFPGPAFPGPAFQQSSFSNPEQIVSIPIPDENSAESYRPPIDRLPIEFFCSSATARSKQAKSGDLADTPKLRLGHSAGAASMCSSASSAGSTPTGGPPSAGRGGPGPASPYSYGSPLSSGGGRSQLVLNQAVVPEHAKSSSCAGGATGSSRGAGAVGSGLTSIGGVAAAVSRIGNSSSSSFVPSAVGTGGYPIVSSDGHLAVPPPVSGGVDAGNASSHPGSAAHTPNNGGSNAGQSRTLRPGSGHSRDGSRGSSPWHLSSPNTSGSDSVVDYQYMQHGYTYGRSAGESGSEDISQSDTPHGSRVPSDSDGCTTPRSGAGGRDHTNGAGSENAQTSWQSLNVEIARVELSRDRMPRRLDITQSPNGAGDFREAVGMNNSGPIVPPITAASAAAAVHGVSPLPQGSSGQHAQRGQQCPQKNRRVLTTRRVSCASPADDAKKLPGT